MTRRQLEHIIRAASSVSDDREIVIFGSQAVLGQFPDAPAELLASMEADVWPKNRPELWDLVDGTLGEGSPFHETFGYYAQGVEEHTAVLPADWKTRLIPIHTENTAPAIGWALEIHDLLVAKLVAGRPKDITFSRTAVREGLAEVRVLGERLTETSMEPALRSVVSARIARLGG